MDLRDTDTGSVQLIIGTNNSDLILPKQIVKPSGQTEVDTVPYAVETLLGWAVTNWLPGGRPVPIVLIKCWKVAHWNAKKLLTGMPKSC